MRRSWSRSPPTSRWTGRKAPRWKPRLALRVTREFFGHYRIKTIRLYALVLKQEYSKTKGRTVSLYWRHSLEAIKEYMNERLSDGIKPQEPVLREKRF